MCGMVRSAHGYVGFVEVWAWGDVPYRNVSAVSLIFLSMLLVLVCFSLGPAILLLPRRLNRCGLGRVRRVPAWMTWGAMGYLSILCV